MTRRSAPRWRKDDAHDWDSGDRRKSLGNDMANKLPAAAQVGETCKRATIVSAILCLAVKQTISALTLPSPFSSPRCPFTAITSRYHYRAHCYRFVHTSCKIHPTTTRKEQTTNFRAWALLNLLGFRVTITRSFAILYHAFRKWNVHTYVERNAPTNRILSCERRHAVVRSCEISNEFSQFLRKLRFDQIRF